MNHVSNIMQMKHQSIKFKARASWNNLLGSIESVYDRIGYETSIQC